MSIMLPGRKKNGVHLELLHPIFIPYMSSQELTCNLTLDRQYPEGFTIPVAFLFLTFLFRLTGVFALIFPHPF